MSADNVVTGVVAGVAVGVIAAIVTMRSERDRMAAEKSEAVTEASFASYNDGWRAALDNPGQVRAAYLKHFEPTEEDQEQGTTFKAARKS